MPAKWMSLDSPCPEDIHGGKFRVIDCKTCITLKHFRNLQMLLSSKFEADPRREASYFVNITSVVTTKAKLYGCNSIVSKKERCVLCARD